MSNITRAVTDLAGADTAVRACEIAAESVARESGASTAVLLAGHDGLRTYAASHAWWTHHWVDAEQGAPGEAYAAGRTVVDYPVDPATAAYPVLPSTVMVACVPIRGGDHRPIGVLKLEWPQPVEAIRWQAAAEPVAVALGERLGDLGEPAGEGMAERLTRYALNIAACGPDDLLAETLRAAREVSGLAVAVGIRMLPEGRCEPLTEAGDTSPLADRFRALGPDDLRTIYECTHERGAWYTRGDPDEAGVIGPAILPEIGVRTAIAIPVGTPGGNDNRAGTTQRVMLALDERVRAVTPTTVSLLELVTAQAMISQERLSLLDSLHARARNDPLTGLGHQVALGERLSRARPGRTALLLVDVDHFKKINEVGGHAAGDTLLVELVDVVQGVLRARDEMYRFGGDEFVVIVEVNRVAEARGIARRIMNAARWVGCTVSVGVAMLAEGESAEDAMRRADAAKYLAKRQGRDRVEVAAAAATA